MDQSIANTNAMSGELWGLRSCLPSNLVSFINLDGKHVVSIKSHFSDFFFILPVYLNVSTRDVNFYNLARFSDEHVSSKFVIIGDLNVRLGLSQTLPDDLPLYNPECSHSRNSKDTLLNIRSINS